MNIETKKRSRTVFKITKDYGRQDGYKCRTCNKRFGTFQALGGHQGTHKRVKLIDASDMCSLNLDVVVHNSGLHRCKTCMKEFETGQALGGHMRRHRIEKDLILKDKGQLWRQQVSENAGSNLMLAAEKVESNPIKTCMEGFENGQALGGHMIEKDFILKGKGRLWRKQVTYNVESNLKFAAEKAESDMRLAGSDLRLSESDLTSAESDLLSSAVAVQQLKAEEDKPEVDKGELIMAAKEWRLSF